MPVDVTELSHVKVTQSHTRETFRGGPVLLAHQSYNDLPRKTEANSGNTSCFATIMVSMFSHINE